jgi:TonB family protein
MRRELQTIHEYEADEAVLDYGIDAKSYQLLLIKKAAGSRLQSITNSLHQSSIKKRITMMLKKKSNPWARAKYLLAVPVAALSVAVLSTPQASALSKEISECKVSEFFANHQISDQKNTPKIEIRTVSGTAEIDKDVIFFVDGKRVESIDDINPENIDHMEVLKDKDAMAKFGITDARGVILITTKSSGQTIHLKLDSVPSAKGEFQPSAEGEFHPAVIIVDPALPMVEDMPEYPGGMEAMMKFVAENLKYPEQMQKEKVEGRVLLSFVVEKDGSVTNIEEVQSPHPVLTEEAIRVVKLMPKWKPGKQDGKEVRVQFNLPITFRLN